MPDSQNLSAERRDVLDADARHESANPASALRDRVVRAAMNHGLVDRVEISRAWEEYLRDEKATRSSRFWRFLAGSRGAEEESFYAIAARTYGFDETDISVTDIIRFTQHIRSRFTAEDWEQLKRLRIVPVGMEQGPSGQAERLVFVSSDPTRIEVNNFLADLSGGAFVLRYARSRSVDYVLDRVLPVILTRRPTSESSEDGIHETGVRLVPLDPIRDLVEDRRPPLRRAA